MEHNGGPWRAMNTIEGQGTALRAMEGYETLLRAMKQHGGPWNIIEGY